MGEHVHGVWVTVRGCWGAKGFSQLMPPRSCKSLICKRQLSHFMCLSTQGLQKGLQGLQQQGQATTPAAGQKAAQQAPQAAPAGRGIER